MSMRILLRAVHLGAHYGGKEFLHDIDFNEVYSRPFPSVR